MRHARYARLYDGIINHAKFVGLAPAAGWLWTLSLAYCHDQLTDGFVPAAQAARLLGVAPKRAGELAAVLVTRRLFDVVDGGWRLHDYLDWNDSRADILAEQERQAERKRRQRHGGSPGGSRGARHAGQNGGQPPGQPQDRTRDGRAQSSTEQYRTTPLRSPSSDSDGRPPVGGLCAQPDRQAARPAGTCALSHNCPRYATCRDEAAG